MVSRIGRGLPLTLSLLFVGALPPAHADGVLEQMENEVATIVKANRGGIVSIEEEATMPPRRGPKADARPNPAQKALLDHLVALQAQQDGCTVQLTKYLCIYKAEHPKVIALKREKEALDGEVQKLNAEVARQPDAPQLQQFLLGQRLAQWGQMRTTLNTDLQKSLTIYQQNHPQIVELKQALQVADQNILVLTQQQGRRGNAPWDRVNAPKSGSGFLVGNGYVVTTADVVEGMQHPLVVADDGTRIKAKLVGIDSRLNLGMLQLPAKVNLPALKMGDSDHVTPGHFAITIGNQSGRSNYAALMTVSGIRSDGFRAGERFYPSLIQVNGTIGAGTSGAPMLNARGEVIGVVVGVSSGEWNETQFYSDAPLGFPPAPPGVSPQIPGQQNPQPSPGPQSSGRRGGRDGGFGGGQAPGFPNGLQSGNVWLKFPGSGTGYAIPINDLEFSINELMAHGKIVQTWVGFLPGREFKMDETDPDIVRPVRSVRIWRVEPDSPASRAGLQQGDTLVELDSKPVVSTSEMFRYITRLHPGDKLAVTFQRNGTKQTANLTVEVRPDRAAPPSQPNQPTRRGQ